MAIDPYAPCPCGSGKKLKFCCKDLAGDIEKVQRMVAGEQPHAALKLLDSLLEKQPQRASLLDLRAMLQLTLHDYASCRSTVETFLSAHPKSPSAHALRAMLIASEEKGSAAVGPLQDALELIGDEMPLRVLEAIGAVGHALLSEGVLVASRAHLLLYAGIAPEGNNLGVEILLRLNMEGNLPLMLREDRPLRDCPEDVPWKVEFDHALKASGRGQWRPAEAIFSSLYDKVGPEPVIVYNLALVRGWLADTDAFVAGLRQYAQLDVPAEDAAEAEALGQMLQSVADEPKMASIRVDFQITDEEALVERLLSDKRVEDYPVSPPGEEEGVPPRSAHLLLDKPTPSASADLKREDIPKILGLMQVFGKRTDRAAQLELTTDRGSLYEQTLSVLKEIAGDALGEQLEERVLGERPASEDALTWSWRMPDGTPSEVRSRLTHEQRRVAILEHWPEAKRGSLGGKSPREAADDPSQRVSLSASVLVLEQGAKVPEELEVFDELRSQLGLPRPEPFDPEKTHVDKLPIMRIPRVELSKLSDQQVRRLMERSVMMNATLATLRLAAELVERASRNEKLDPSMAFRQAIRSETRLDRALEWVEKARSWARSRRRSDAEWVLLKLEIGISQPDAATAQSALEEIRTSYSHEPGVGEATYQMLYEAGLIDPEKMASPGRGQQVPSPAPEAGAGSQKLWVPQEGTPASDADAGEETEKKSVIWTP